MAPIVLLLLICGFPLIVSQFGYNYFIYTIYTKPCKYNTNYLTIERLLDHFATVRSVLYMYCLSKLIQEFLYSLGVHNKMLNNLITSLTSQNLSYGYYALHIS